MLALHFSFNASSNKHIWLWAILQGKQTDGKPGQVDVTNRYLNGPCASGAIWLCGLARKWNSSHLNSDPPAMRLFSVSLAKAGRCRQTTLCLDTSSQTWKQTGQYAVNTHVHTCTHTLSSTVLAETGQTDGKTAESREEVEIKVTVSGRTIIAQGLILHVHWLTEYNIFISSDHYILAFFFYYVGVLARPLFWSRLKYLSKYPINFNWWSLMTLGILWPFIEYYHQGNNVPYPVNCLYIDMVRHKMLYFNLQYMGQSSNFRILTNTLSGWLWVNCVKAKYLKFHTFLVQAVLIWKTTTKVDSESSILSPIFTFPVGQRPLVAILIVTTAKEEKQYKEQQV